MVIVRIAPEVTEQQRSNPRFIQLLGEAQTFFNCSCLDCFSPKVRDLICLHEGGHSFFAKKAGATDVVFNGPTMKWDYRPERGYDCPSISRSSVEYVLSTDSVLEYFMPCVAGYVCRRELTDSPNDELAISSDIDNARRWFDKHVGTGDKDFDDANFELAIEDAEDAVVKDLRSPAIGRGVRAEAKRFREEIFPAPRLTSGLLRARRLGWMQ